MIDEQKLLEAYVSAIEAKPLGLSLQAGLVGRDPVLELVEIGKRWKKLNVAWTSTGLIAANVVAPFITSVNSVEVYVNAKTIVGLEAVAKKANLLGAKVVITGLQPQVAAELTELNLHLEGIKTERSLQNGVTFAMNYLKKS